jgi:hypothetical protein
MKLLMTPSARTPGDLITFVLGLLVTVLGASAPWAVRPVSADPLIVQDTSGFTRAAEEVSAPARVEFAVSGPNVEAANGVEVTLTSTSGEVVRATAVNGVVVFDAVPAGLWTVGTESQGILFTNVAITGGVVATGTVGGVAIGAAAVAVAGGGAIAIVSATDDDDDEDLSPAS